MHIDRTSRSLPIRRLAVAVTLVAALASASAAPAATTSASSPYRGAGAWIDIYDQQLLSRPLEVVDTLVREGARTLYLETANYKQGPHTDIVYPIATAALIEAAHARNLRVVAWYLPSFDRPRLDLRRSMAAIRFTTPTGQRFDSFALDIEANRIRSVTVRNPAMLRLSRSIRRRVGRKYQLGAIVPDSTSTTLLSGLWPLFPYAAVARLYDVFLPMSYSSARAKGPSNVYSYTLGNIAFVRQRTGRPSAPVHIIGGLANRLSAAESGAVVAAARSGLALGASFYDMKLSGSEDWAALRTLSAR
jgi:hypothetical protein